MDLTGQTVGPYHIQDEIGRGGTAVVYRATDARSGQTVALKILPPLLAADPMFLKRFIKEGQNAARLRHENIVATYEAGETSGYYYIAMELVNGGTLADLSSQRGELFSMEENINILSQLAAALDFAHSQELLHRDVKPSNVLMAEDGRVLLADFGTVKQMFGEHTMMTAPSQRIGTPSFMSPEQIAGDAPIDARSDVYSLGVIAYKLFTGRLPLAADNQAELLHKIVYETPIPPEMLNPELPYPIVHHLKRVLAKDPKQRYESAGQFVAALVIGQMWASKFASNQTAATARGRLSSKLATPVRHSLKLFKAVARPVLAALLIGALVLIAGFTLRDTSLAQLQKQSIAQADSLSSALMDLFESPKVTTTWTTYGDPVVSHLNPDALRANLGQYTKKIETEIGAFNDPNGWVQRTWRYLNRVKVSELFN